MRVLIATATAGAGHLQAAAALEEANSDFLLEHGAALKINRVEDLPFKLGQVFAGNRLAALTKSAKALGRPQAAKDICAAVVERYS